MIRVNFYEQEETVTYIQVENNSLEDKVCQVYLDGEIIGIVKVPAMSKKEIPTNKYKDDSSIQIKTIQPRL